MQKINRREFLKAGLYTTLALGTPLTYVNCQTQKNIQKPSQRITAQEIDSQAINARVAAIRGDNLDSMTRDAIDALGGIY